VSAPQIELEQSFATAPVSFAAPASFESARVPIVFGSLMSEERSPTPDTYQDKGMQHTGNVSPLGTPQGSDQSLVSQVAHISATLVALQLDMHKWAGIADNTAQELQAEMIEQEASQQQLAQVYNHTTQSQHAFQSIEQTLSHIGLPLADRGVPIALLCAPHHSAPSQFTLHGSRHITHEDAPEHESPMPLIKIEERELSRVSSTSEALCADPERWCGGQIHECLATTMARSQMIIQGS
jgi:hypothetical protein